MVHTKSIKKQSFWDCILQKKAFKKMAAGRRLGEIIEMREEVIKKACSLAMKAHKSPGKPYLLEKTRSSSDAIFCFVGSWSVDDWFARRPFGETKIDLGLFPSIRSIGIDEVGLVNEAFLRRFEAILGRSSLQHEVEKAMKDKKQIVFTGHSSAGPMAILATIWFLEKYTINNHIAPLCVTFGSPLVGDRIFPHALRRENWSRYFVHFVMRYDIVPRTLLAPLSSIERELQSILRFLNPNSTFFQHESNEVAREASVLYTTVMRNALSVASHVACYLMESTNLLLGTVTSFIELSPYRPFGTYIFCTGNGKLVVVKNPDAVLQLLFYCLQLSSEAEGIEVAYRSLKEHLIYEHELQESLEMQNIVYLDHLEEIPLSSDGGAEGEIVTINMALNDLGLSTRARLCLRAAGELEKQKMRNQAKIDHENKRKIEYRLNMLEKYQAKCEVRKMVYYDAFKLQKEQDDFQTNVKRLELAGMWDEIIEMLRRYELPDGFEGEKEWIELGTRYGRIVEPLDIANYYRHLKNDDTGPYLLKGRPKRYRYTQRWREHAQRMLPGSSSESCFWAEIEELCISTSNRGSFEDVKEKVLQLEIKVKKWVQDRDLGKDVFLEDSTFIKWWKTLPHQHRSVSCIAEFMNR